MSLINDMLRDLEKREQQQGGATAPANVPLVTAPRRSGKVFAVAALLAVLALLIWFGVVMVTSGTHRVPARQTAVAAPTPVKTDSPSAQISVATAEKPGGENSAATVENDTPVAVVAPLPSPAEQGTTAAAEETPAMFSTLSITHTDEKSVLRLSFSQLPQYQLLEQGSTLVVALDHVELGDDLEIPETADSLVDRLSLVPQKGALQLLIDLTAGAQIHSSRLIETLPSCYDLQFEFVAPKPAAVDVEPVVAVVEPKVTDDPQPPLAEAPKEQSVTKINKKRPAVLSDKQAYQNGLTQLQAGRYAAAESAFGRALQLNPEFLDARLQLVALLQQQRKFVKAEKLLQQGLSRSPESAALRRAYARQLLQEQRSGQAIEVLQTPPVPRIAHDLEYHALLAAALQGAGEYRAASTVYAQLVNLRPKEALWWLGMATSLEQSGVAGEARSAYQKALSLPGLRPDLQSYIQGRLQAL